MLGVGQRWSKPCVRSNIISSNMKITYAKNDGRFVAVMVNESGELNNYLAIDNNNSMRKDE